MNSTVKELIRRPFLRLDVGNVLGKRPPVASVVLHRVLAFTKRHVGRCLHDLRCEPVWRFIVVPYVIYGDENVLADLICAGRERTAPFA
jgi:hypothetical protein